MEQAVPLIFTRDSAPPPMGWFGRLMAGAIAAACLSMLIIGAWLTPSGTGYSTHTQLGLEPCQFKIRTGIPCPSCGYTTAVTHFAHGQVLASLYTQPMGCAIALLACVVVWVGGYILVTGRPVHRLVTYVHSKALLIVLLTVSLGGWGWKIWLSVSGRDH